MSLDLWMPLQKYRPFQDIWILDKQGRIIYVQKSKYQTDETFLKMLFEGLNDFVNDYFKDKVTNFRLGGRIYTFLNVEDFLFIGSSKIKKNTKKL